MKLSYPKRAWPAVGLLVLAASAPPALAQAAPSYADVAPILAERCVMCHSDRAHTAGLSLESHAAVLKGSARGPVVKAGAPAESELIRRLKGISQPRMPLTGPPFLSDAEIALFERWVAGGLQQGAAASAAEPAAPPRPGPGEQITYQHVAPIFAARCAKCHAEKGLMGPAPEGYLLTSHESTLSTADRVRVVPGHPGASELVRRIRGQAHPRMPFDGPPYLAEEEIRLIEDWIAQGAKSAAGTPAGLPAGASVRLHGTLGADRRLDGLELVIGPGTRIDKQTLPGMYVEVRGTLAEDGKVVVERLRAR